MTATQIQAQPGRNVGSATPKLDHLAKLNSEVAEARTRPRQIETEWAEAKAKAEAIREELTEAFASGNSDLEQKLTRAVPKAQALADQPWPERIAGARRAGARLEHARDTWTRANYPALIREMTPEAEAVANGITGHIDALRQAVTLWSGVEQRVAAIARSAGQDPEVMPRIDMFQQALRSFLREVPEVVAPLPRTIPSTAVTIAPEHDPDPEIRVPAQEKLRREHENKLLKAGR